MGARTTIVSFDSAWTDKASALGAICAIRQTSSGLAFEPPVLITFSQALEFVRGEQRRADRVLVALDQPTIVENTTGSRPVGCQFARVLDRRRRSAGKSIQDRHVPRHSAHLEVQRGAWCSRRSGSCARGGRTTSTSSRYFRPWHSRHSCPGTVGVFSEQDTTPGAGKPSGRIIGRMSRSVWPALASHTG